LSTTKQQSIYNKPGIQLIYGAQLYAAAQQSPRLDAAAQHLGGNFAAARHDFLLPRKGHPHI
jgi:hypothetical protein